MDEAELARSCERATCYVYRIDNLEGVPVYIGKGGGDRYRDRLWGKRNPQITALIKAAQTRKPVRVASDLRETDAFAEEARLIALHGRADLGAGTLLNLTDGGLGQRGRIVPLKHRAKIAAFARTRTHTPETRAKMSAAKKGKPKSPEHVANVVAALRRPEVREKLAAASRERGQSPEARAKLSASLSGRKLSPEHVAKMRARKQSPEHIAKRLAAIRRRLSGAAEISPTAR